MRVSTSILIAAWLRVMAAKTWKSSDPREKTGIAMSRVLICITWILLIVVTVGGCRGTYDASAKGLVTLNGSALTRGWVAFHPASGGPAAYASIDSSGSYVIRTGAEEGLRPG